MCIKSIQNTQNYAKNTQNLYRKEKSIYLNCIYTRGANRYPLPSGVLKKGWKEIFQNGKWFWLTAKVTGNFSCLWVSLFSNIIQGTSVTFANGESKKKM